MAQNTVVKVGETWTELTNTNATNVTFQVKNGKAEIAASTSAADPASDATTLQYVTGSGEVNMPLLELFPGIAGVRLFGRAVSGSYANVAISHA